MFKKAEKKKVFVKVAIQGPSGAGKTMSALRMARGIVGPKGKIALIDTENDSASLYADAVPPGGIEPIVFDSAVMAPPFLVNKYTQMITAAEQAGYDIVIIDSMSHAWQELLSKKEALDSRGGNSFTNWSTITKDHEQFKHALLQSRIHVIGCMRSKQEYILETNEKGKQSPKKVGMAAVQREGLEYEFTCVFDIGMDHQYQVSKDRTGIFDGRIEVMSENTGKMLNEWLKGGAEMAAEQPPIASSVVPQAQEATAEEARSLPVKGIPYYLVRIMSHQEEERERLKKAGFRWDPRDKSWSAPFSIIDDISSLEVEYRVVHR